MTRWISPDCRDGNHRKCDGQAWNEDLDDVDACDCPDCLCQVSPAPERRTAAHVNRWSCSDPDCDGPTDCVCGAY